jgi:hypothetical protein
VRHLGLSEVSAEEVRAAHSLHPIACVELEWSLFSREAEVGGWVVWCGCKGRWGGGGGGARGASPGTARQLSTCLACL